MGADMKFALLHSPRRLHLYAQWQLRFLKTAKLPLR